MVSIACVGLFVGHRNHVRKGHLGFRGNRGLDGPAGVNIPVGRFLVRRSDLKTVGDAAYLRLTRNRTFS